MAEAQPAPKPDVTVVKGPSEPGGLPTITVVRTPETRHRTPDGLAAERLRAIAGQPTYTVVDRRPFPLACGVAAVAVDLLLRPEPVGRESFTTMVFVVDEETAYELTLLDPSRTGPERAPDRTEALRSFVPGRPFVWPGS